jgi:DNA-binding transcriptional ArsR family regulator
LADLDLPEPSVPPATPATALATTDIAAAADLFRILSDATRLRILAVLAGKPHNVTDLRKRLGVPQPTTSHHLNQLRRFDLVTSRRAGKQMVYSLGPCIHTDGDGSLLIETCVPGTRLKLFLRPNAAAERVPAVAQAVASAWPV